LFEFFRRAVTAIGLAGGDQFLHLGPVQVKAVRLINRTFVIIESQPIHRLQNRIDRRLGAARDIGIFNAENEGPLLLAGEEKIEKGGTRSSDMQIAGGAGGKTDTKSGHEKNLRFRD
jgi:hypothetical protein